ncbi:MAG: hypothetical protein ACLFMX_05955 [Halobacteriales archaeon]
MPSRRRLLAAIGTAPLVGVAGCLGLAPRADADDPRDTPEFDYPDDPDRYPAFDDDHPVDVQIDRDDADDTVEIGSREGVPDRHRPHHLQIADDVGGSTVEIGIYDALADEPVHGASHDLPEDGVRRFSLLEPSKYVLVLRVPDLEAERTLRVPCSFFDCNLSQTDVLIREDGTIHASVVSTLVACSDPFEC